MGFQRQADLNDAKAQQDQANGADDRKHERRKVVDDAHRVFFGQRRHGAEKAGNSSVIEQPKRAEMRLQECLNEGLFVFFMGITPLMIRRMEWFCIQGFRFLRVLPTQEVGKFLPSRSM